MRSVPWPSKGIGKDLNELAVCCSAVYFQNQLVNSNDDQTVWMMSYFQYSVDNKNRLNPPIKSDENHFSGLFIETIVGMLEK